MKHTLVLTFVGQDRTGLVQDLAQTVAAHHGNWLESRMAELAGQFAGIVKIEVTPHSSEALRAALMALSGPTLSVVVASSQQPLHASGGRELRLSILGNDRPGIVREVAHALAERQINVVEMDTDVRSAPMSGDQMFSATARIAVPHGLDLDELNQQLDAISNALTLDIDLDAPLR